MYTQVCEEFTTAVTIPANTLSNTTDIVTVTATSLGDSAVKDSAILTTKCIELVPMAYLPLILRMP